MPSSRLTLILGILAGFAAGVGLGSYFAATSPASGTPQPQSNLDPLPPATRTTPATLETAEPNPAASNHDPHQVIPSTERFWACLTIPDDFERQYSWLSILKHLRKEDAANIPQLFRAMQKQGLDPTFEADAFWFRWGVLDGPNALKHAGDFGADTARVMRGFSQTDPEAARAWLREHSDFQSIDWVIGGFVAGYAQRDLDGATRYTLGKIGSGGNPLVGPVSSLITAARQQRQYTGLIDWYEALPESALKKAAFKSIIQQRVDGELQLDWVAGKAASPERDDNAISSFAGSLDDNSSAARKDPLRGLDWVSKLPPSPTTGRYDGLDHVLARLIQRNPAAAQQWLARPDLAPALKAQAQPIFDRYAPRPTGAAPSRVMPER